MIIIDLVLPPDTSAFIENKLSVSLLRECVSDAYAAFLYRGSGVLQVKSDAQHLFIVPRLNFQNPIDLVVDDEHYQFLPKSPDAALFYIPPFHVHQLQLSTAGEWILLKVSDRRYCQMLDRSPSCISKGAFVNRRQIRGVSVAPIEPLFTCLQLSPDRWDESVANFLVACFGRDSLVDCKYLSENTIDHDKITGYMWQHIEDHLSLDHLASLAFLSKYHFLRCFKSLTGQSPLVFFRGMRVFKARYLFNTSSSLPCMADVALECGFSDQAHLSRIFKKHTGMTPTAYRKLMTITSECS